MIPASNFAISVERQGARNLTKASNPLRYGKFSEIRTAEHEFRFDLNGAIRSIRGLTAKWPHPSEQLKRTDGNDWVYYTVGDRSGADGIKSWLGEYYLPCLPYPSNSVWEVDYLTDPDIMQALGAWSQLLANLHGASRNELHPKARELVDRILKNDDRVLHERAQELNAIIGERVSVLPPDTRHVDYDVIPLHIADGCLYHCKFCCVQSTQPFQSRSIGNIREQLKRLKVFYGRDIENYQALYLGNHDALAAGVDLICLAAMEAHDTLGFSNPHSKRAEQPLLFLFGSVTSLLRISPEAFAKLDQLPFRTYINIGLESFDSKTLALIGKPLAASQVRQAFKRLLDINANYANLEITGNFVMGEQLPPDHRQSLAQVLNDIPDMPLTKGAIYLSPLQNSLKKRELLPLFYELKKRSKLPIYIYLIQRL